MACTSRDEVIPSRESLILNSDALRLRTVCKRLKRNDDTLTTLSLPFRVIRDTPNGMAKLVAALIQSDRLIEMELLNARPTAQDAAALSILVQQHASLRVLKLPDCHSNGLVPILLFQALQQRRRRQPKGNNNNNKDNDDSIHNSTLQVLELSGDSIDIAAAGALQSLLQTNTTLRALKLTNAAMDRSAERAMVRGLSSNKTLTVLILTNCSLTDQFVQDLAEQVLAVTKKRQQHQQQHQSRGSSALRELHLDRNLVTDLGAAALAPVISQSRLLVLSLALNRLTVAGLQAFCGRLPQYKYLQHLNLYNGDLCLPHRAFARLVDGLQENYTLLSLSVGCESSSSFHLLPISSSSSSSSSIVEELRFLWQEPAYTAAVTRLSYLLHMNKSGRKHLQGDGSVVPDALLPIVLHKFQHPQQQGASALFALLRQRPTVVMHASLHVSTDIPV
jgi:Ran GTPase-activating protein (RanGAP) involved in mRNA processing and transport